MSFSVSRKRSLRCLSFVCMAHSIGGGQDIPVSQRHLMRNVPRTAKEAAEAAPDGPSCRQRVLDQLDPVGRAENNRVVIEILGGVVEAGAVAVAAENKGPRTLFQHVGKI